MRTDGGREYPRLAGTIRSVTVGVSSVQVVDAGQGRKTLLFTPPATGRITLSTATPAVDGVGLALQGMYGPVQMKRCDWGDLLDKPIFAVADAAGRVLGIAESYDEV